MSQNSRNKVPFSPMSENNRFQNKMDNSLDANNNYTCSTARQGSSELRTQI